MPTPMPTDPAPEPVGSQETAPDDELELNDAWNNRLGPIGSIRLRDWSAIVRKAKSSAPADADQDRRAA